MFVVEFTEDIQNSPVVSVAVGNLKHAYHLLGILANANNMLLVVVYDGGNKLREWTKECGFLSFHL